MHGLVRSITNNLSEITSLGRVENALIPSDDLKDHP